MSDPFEKSVSREPTLPNIIGYHPTVNVDGKKVKLTLPDYMDESEVNKLVQAHVKSGKSIESLGEIVA
jgi:site-specific recombinase XerD